MASALSSTFLRHTLNHLKEVPSGNPIERQRMAVLEGEKQGESRCIMVGLQMNAKGKELLDWAIHKVAEQGDRVMAVHVCRDSGTSI